MNRIFKIIWSKSKRTYIVVSEFANACGGKKKLTASVLAFVMGISAGTGFVSALTPSEENIVKEVMKQVEANYVKKGNRRRYRSR